jgi:endonuclease-8
MPEGDTIHRAAATLSKAIAGRRVLRAEPETMSALVDRTVDAVEARGKHLLVRFDDGHTLHTHMRMDGSWHIYRPGERWWRGAHRAVAVLETEAWVAVCFDAPIVELLPPGEEPALVQRLGPDLLDPSVDLDEAIARMRTLASMSIGEAVMRQDAVAGIGNVYKSEVLFLRRVDPFAALDTLDDAALLAILREAQRLLRRNLSTRRRTTRERADGRLWVYGRSGQPCFACGTRIRMRRQGELARSTYYCPRCQGITIEHRA